MSINALDTHRAVKALREVGFDENQAEIMVDTVNKSINENVVTKTDLEVDRRDVQAESKTEFDKVKDEIRGLGASYKAGFDEVRAEIRGLGASYKAGFGEVRAEIRGLGASYKAGFGEVKTEISGVRAEIKDLKVRMEQFETRMENKMEASEQRIINRLGGLMIVLSGLVVAAVKIL